MIQMRGNRSFWGLDKKKPGCWLLATSTTGLWWPHGDARRYACDFLGGGASKAWRLMTQETKADSKVVKSEAEWRHQLTPEQYQVTREAATERAFTGKYWKTKDAGTYHCVCC